MNRPGKALLLVALLCVLLALPASAGADTYRTAVIAYYASDETGPEPGLEEKIAKTMFGAPSPPNVYTVQEYFLAQTFGKVDFSGGPSDVFGPYQLATPKANCPWPTWNNEAASIAQGDGFSHSNYDAVVYIYENEPFVPSQCSAAGTGSGSFVWIDSLSDYTIVHELGHLLGSPHAAAFRCWDGVTPVTYSGNCREVFPPGDESSEYGDPFDPMGFGHVGSFPAEMTAWRKLEFGAIPSGDAPTIATDGTYVISPLEQSSGVRLLRIPNGAGEFIDLDFRQPIGPFDQGYGTSPAVNGVAIHVDTAGFDSNRPSRLLDTTPETPSFGDAPLTVGRQFRDFDSPLTIETLSVGPGGATVKISGLPVLTAISNRVEKCKVPALKRKKKKAARKALRKRDCRLGKVKLRPSKKVPKGKVISQKPKAGKQVKANTKVNLVVSSGPPRS